MIKIEVLWQQLTVCALNETYTTNANPDWNVNIINTAYVDSFSVQEVD